LYFFPNHLKNGLKKSYRWNFFQNIKKLLTIILFRSRLSFLSHQL